METDTIAAIATAMTDSGIGIVRISGKEALWVLSRIFQPKKRGLEVTKLPSHTVTYGHVYDGETMIDEVLVLYMKGPYSYTAEDTVEIDCHGGVLVMKRVLETVVRNGARPAQAGEFTKRAFLNGRIDLSQAEAVMDIIQAKNEHALRSSVRQLKGSVLRLIQKLREQILYEIAFIESALDDPEHVSLEGYPGRLGEKVDNLLKETGVLLIRAEQGRILKEGIRTVIIGKPNAGKSSLLNVLTGEARAIVTEIPGTTRDVLEEQVRIGGLILDVVDTAGIRRTEDLVEKIGVDRAKESLKDADLVLYVVDSSTPLDENDREIMELLKDQRVIVLLNKTDLPMETAPEMVEEILAVPTVAFSAKEETGLDVLEELLEEMFLDGKAVFDDEACLTSVRHRAAMEEAEESLKKVAESIALGMPEDFYSIDLTDAYEALGRILGESMGEDLVNEIFGKFCMGK